MKKLLKIMFGAVAAASVMCGLAACDGGDGECEHVWNEGETTVAATCTEDGVLTYTCTLCDEERTEPIARLGHDFTGEWQKDAQGHWHKCSRCEAADDVVAHTMEDGEVITPATEEEEGTQKIVCSVCGYESIKTLPVLVGHSAASEWSSDDTYHWHVCTAHGDCGMQLDKSEHDWTETDRVEATETANGKVTYECSVCKAAKEEILYYDGHVAATEWSSDKTHHWHKCTAHENCAEQMDKAEHDWDDGEVTKAATCAQKGEKTFTCETCGATKTEEIPQLAHDFSEEWSSDAEGHWHKCKNCDATDTKAAHDMIYKNDEASGKHIGECKVCGYKGSPADHVWGEGEVTKPATLYAKGERTFTCECGAKKTETIAAGADFAADFTVENQDGAWSYGKAEVTAWEADKFAFKFTAATDKNADSWLIGGLAIKSGWVNADGTLAIGYKVEKDIIAQIRAEFKGTNATSRTSLRLAVMRGGALAGTAQFAADENSNAVSLERTVSLKAGDVLYIIINKEGTDGMGALNVTLTPATEEQSKHTASQEWSHDESSHWKTCASHLYCTEQLDKAAHKTVLNKVDDANHSADCECGYKAVAPHDWNDGVVTEEATCTQDGVKTFTCECGATKTEKIDRLGHDFAEEWAGDEDYHWHKCSRCDATNDKAEHQWTETDRTPATETENGKVTYECSVCKATKEEVLYYDPHVAAKEWSHDENYHWHACTAHENCAEQMDKAEHDWDDGVVTEEATCTQKGERTFTCTCGATKTEEIAQLDHDFTGDWLSDADGHWHKCKNCDATDEKVAHEMQYIDAPESNKHSSECKVCGYKGSPADHVWGEGEVTKPATLYAKGERTFTCECGAKKTETIAAGADFAADFTVENQDGAWSYGKAEVTAWEADKFAFKFTAATDKNADSWLIGGLAIKSGWVNADGTLAIGYKVASDITANISVNFTGNDANSRVSLRLIVKGADGRLRIPVQFNMTDNTASLNNTVSLKAGDEVYVIANKENAEGITTNGMGSLKITLTPAQTVADFGADFSLENQGGDWSYGKADYKWSSEDNPGEDFTFVKAEGKNEGGDGWVSGGVEIKKDFISFGEMAAVGYTNNTQGELTFKAVITVCGGTADTRADLRIGVKDADGTLKNGPSSPYQNPDGNILYVTVDITLAAGDTVYFLFSNSAGGNEGAWPNGNLYISLVGAQA